MDRSTLVYPLAVIGAIAAGFYIYHTVQKYSVRIESVNTATTESSSSASYSAPAAMMQLNSSVTATF